MGDYFGGPSACKGPISAWMRHEIPIGARLPRNLGSLLACGSPRELNGSALFRPWGRGYLSEVVSRLNRTRCVWLAATDMCCQELGLNMQRLGRFGQRGIAPVNMGHGVEHHELRWNTGAQQRAVKI